MVRRTYNVSQMHVRRPAQQQSSSCCATFMWTAVAKAPKHSLPERCFLHPYWRNGAPRRTDQFVLRLNLNAEAHRSMLKSAVGPRSPTWMPISRYTAQWPRLLLSKSLFQVFTGLMRKGGKQQEQLFYATAFVLMFFLLSGRRGDVLCERYVSRRSRWLHWA